MLCGRESHKHSTIHPLDPQGGLSAAPLAGTKSSSTMNNTLHPLRMEQIRDVLSSREKSRDFYCDFVEQSYPAETLESKEEQEMALALRGFIRETFAAELEWIEQASESPIEQMFCAAVLLIARIKYFNLLRFTPPVGDGLSNYRQEVCDWIQTTMEWEQEAEKQAGSAAEITEFLDFLVEQGKMSEDERSGLMFYRGVYLAMGYKDAFHLTQQSPLPSTATVDGHGVRPDLYVWLPLDDSFNLLIECDGYAYHKDRQSFTSDRRRDRALKALGYEVLRFSGLEIHANPLQAALDLVEYLKQRQPGVVPSSSG
jgi:hypothetical protein